MAFKKNREVAVDERDRKIAEMGIDELRKYLCMKNNQKPEACKNCPGIKNCTAGQRAVVLLNEKEQRETTKYRQVKNQEMWGRFIEALRQPDMTSWLMSQDGISKDAARTKLRYWSKAFPDTAEKYGFNDKFTSEMESRANNKHNAKLREEGLARYKEAMSYDDPVGFICNKYDIKRDRAIIKIAQWKKKYGVIEKEEQPVSNMDEMSIEEFLNEQESEPVAEPVKESPQTDKIEKDVYFYGELNAKFDKLGQEKDQIIEQIKALNDRLEWLQKAQDALAMTANLFNPNSAIGAAFQ